MVTVAVSRAKTANKEDYGYRGFTPKPAVRDHAIYNQLCRKEVIYKGVQYSNTQSILRKSCTAGDFMPVSNNYYLGVFHDLKH